MQSYLSVVVTRAVRSPGGEGYFGYLPLARNSDINNE